MKLAPLVIGIVFVSLLALSTSPGASAETRTLSPGVPFSKTVHADTLDLVNYSWSVSPSSSVVEFIIIQPGGTTYWTYNGSSYDFFIIAGISGDYTFRWTNPGTSPVTLTYDVQSAGTSVEHAFDIALIMMAIGAIVVVVIIVLIVFLVLRGGKKAPQQPTMGPPQQYAPAGETPAPYTPGMCPRCGSPIDSQHVFCPKCGFRVR